MKRWVIGAALSAVLLSSATATAAPPRNGQIVFASNRATAGRDLCVVNRDGTGEPRLTFTNLFNANNPKADCDTNGTFDLFDFLCFQNEFAKGCP
jgi:hypothetical protein